MKKIIALLVLFFGGSIALLVLFLSSSGANPDADKSYYKSSVSSTFESDNGYYIKYTTDSKGNLQKLSVDKYLTLQESLYLTPTVDTESSNSSRFELLTSANCTTTYDDNYPITYIPTNMVIEGKTYKFDNSTCLFETVSSLNVVRNTSRKIALNEVIIPGETYTTYFDSTKFVSTYDINLSTTYNELGIYASSIVEQSNGSFVLTPNYYDTYSKVFINSILAVQNFKTALSKLDKFTDLELLDHIFDENGDYYTYVEEFVNALKEWVAEAAVTAPEFEEETE